MTLREANAIVKPLAGGGGVLRFRCPVCPSGHSCVVPFHDGPPVAEGPVAKVWRRVAGSTVDDLTLDPSYQLPCLHVTITGGRLERAPG